MKGAPIKPNNAPVDRGAPGALAFTITNSNPTNSRTLALTYATHPEVGSTYCLRENNTSSNGCVFSPVPLPATFEATTANGPVAITLFLRDSTGKISATSTSSPVTIDTTAPGAPSGLTLKTPADTPNTATSVTYAVSGVSSGDTVALYSAAGCASPSFITSEVAAGSTIDISTTYSNNGSYSVHALSSDPAGNTSACSSASASYTLNGVAPTLSYEGASGTSGAVGQALSVAPTTLNNHGAPITACGIKSGTTALPAWADVNASTCVISGTPNALLNPTTYTLVATNSEGTSADAVVSLGVSTARLLDATNAHAAFSVTRKLRTAYSGSAIRIRRSSDNTEQDIGFTAEGVLDTAAISAFVSNHSAFIRRVYDQTGNGRHREVANVPEQPRIVNAGTLETVGSKPAANFYASESTLWGLDILPSSKAYSIYLVYRAEASRAVMYRSGVNQYAYASDSGDENSPHSQWAEGTDYKGGSPVTLLTRDALNSSMNTGAQLLHSIMNATPGATWNNDFHFGGYYNIHPDYAWRGHYQEEVIYAGDDSASRTSRESNMNAFYSVHSTPTLPEILPGVSVIHPQLTNSVNFTSFGGSGPMSYSVISGSGSINGSSGAYTVGSSFKRGTSSIRMTDSADNTSDATLYQIASRFNGEVRAIAVANGFGYFGGSFTAYNPHLMNGLGKIHSTTGDLESGCNLAGLLNPGANVLAFAETPTHLFVGGIFSAYAGTPVQNLMKIDKQTCKLDTTFTQVSGFSGKVFGLAVSGNSLYVGGEFATYRGAPSQNLAKVDLTTGNLDTAFTQTTGFDGLGVCALAVSGTSLYVGGYFSTYRGAPAERLAKVDLTTGNLDTTFTQSTGITGDSYSKVAVLAISGSSLYAGGEFTSYRGITIQNLAKVDLTSGNLDTTFTKSTGFDDMGVRSLAVSGTSLYVGGYFRNYRGAPAQGLAKIDLITGNLNTSFTQSAAFVSSTSNGGLVSTLAISGTSLYIGGQFRTYRGAPAQLLAKVDLATGNLDTTFTQTTGMNWSVVRALAVSGSSVYVGGNFTIYRGTPAERLARINLTTGNLDTTFTQTTGMNHLVRALAISGSSLYVGGYFTTYRGATAERLAKLDLTTGNLDTTFTQSTGINGGDFTGVSTLAISGTSLYVGGQFNSYRGTAAERLAKVDLGSGNLDTTFTQSTGLDDEVRALAITGSSLYVGGRFWTYRGAPARRLAKIDLTTGNLDTAFTQSTGIDNSVHALAFSGGSLYLGGRFESYRGAPAKNLAKVDLASGNLDTTFTQSTGLNYDGDIHAMVVSGTSLYLGGDFITYRGAPAGRMAKVDLTSGDLDTTFTQSTGINSGVLALAISGTSLYAGGSFISYRGTGPLNSAPYFLSVDLTSGNPSDF